MAEDDKAEKGRPGGRGGRVEAMMERTGDDMQNAARETTGAIDEAARNAEKTGTEGMGRAFDLGRDMGRDAGQDLNRIAERTSRNLATLTKAGSVLMQGMQDASREWIGMTQEQMRRNSEAMSEMSRLRSMPELVNAQADLMRDGIRAMVDGVRRLGEISLRTATETSDAMREAAAPGEQRRRDAA